MAFLTVGVGLVSTSDRHAADGEQSADIRSGRRRCRSRCSWSLRAFASGTTALTGVEAISNGITAFKEPRSRNAGRTLVRDVGHPRHADAGDHLPVPARSAPCRPNAARRSSRSSRGPSSATSSAALPGDHCIDHPDPAHGGQHGVRRLPPAWPPCMPATASCPGNSPTRAAGWSFPAASWRWA